jgi:RNA polymerase sigma-70 factor, ECF subfamily
MKDIERPEEKTDEELVGLVLKNPDDFLYLARRYEEKLLRYIQRISGCAREDAEDVLQEIFIKVYRNLNDFDPSLKFSSWIYRIAHNQVVSSWRKKKARPEGSSTSLDGEISFFLKSELDIESEVDSVILKEAVKKSLGKLDEKYREVLVLRFFEGLDYSEIADVLKKPDGTVATLINRAKKKFKEIYEREYQRKSVE